ncbi:MAG: sigma-70 family RNA polymerase sigma factor [Solirubrobacteraceae bacterium]
MNDTGVAAVATVGIDTAGIDERMAAASLLHGAGEGSANGLAHGAGDGPSSGPTRGDERNSPLVSRAIVRAQAGDRDAMGFLYARYAENIHGYVRSIVRNHHEAEDITQHVFTKLMRVIGKYEERDVPFLAWALRVARNVTMDHIRAERLVPVEEVYATGREQCDPAAGGAIDELREALDTLPCAQREVLILRHVAGLSPLEIAKLTGKSEGSIHGLHHRGRRTLAAELANRGMAPTTMAARARG